MAIYFKAFEKFALRFQPMKPHLCSDLNGMDLMDLIDLMRLQVGVFDDKVVAQLVLVRAPWLQL